VWPAALQAEKPAALLQSVGAGMPRSQRHESRHEIDQLETQWRDAVLTPNTKVMDSLLADDYLAITPSGTVQTKEQTLTSMQSGRTHLSTLAISDRKVRFYGSTAVVTSMAEVQGTIGDEPLSGSFRYTRVYVHDPRGGWKIVSFEASKVREPGDHK
jgi:ketosteroid isomerase-like protein